jgi:polysaccharide pyruvyl transferase WcaK-like protein
VEVVLTAHKRAGRGERSATTPRIGFFGHLGAQNIGNDASLEAMLRYLRAERPSAIVDAMCPGPERLKEQYGVDAIPLFWQHKFDQRMSGTIGIGVKALGKGVDIVRTASWVRRHDVVIVPGAGVLEASLPLWPWGMPYALFLLSLSGRLFGTKVAFVSVGAAAINQRLTRWLSNSAARLAFYRSYRDAGAREAMRLRGLDVSRDHVYPDLAFALPVPPDDPADPYDPNTVGVGVMAYSGSNDQRRNAKEIHSSYVAAMKQLVRYLVDSGRRVRLFVGDTNGSDDSVVQEILADLRETRPDLEPSRVIAQPTTSFTDVMQAMQPVGSVIAIRYHNIVCSVALSKPTISIGYSPKHDVLMEEMGLAKFCQSVDTLDIGQLIEQLTELEGCSVQLQRTMHERNAVKSRLIEDQFAELSAVLFSVAEPAHTEAVHEPAI